MFTLSWNVIYVYFFSSSRLSVWLLYLDWNSYRDCRPASGSQKAVLSDGSMLVEKLVVLFGNCSLLLWLLNLTRNAELQRKWQKLPRFDDSHWEVLPFLLLSDGLILRMFFYTPVKLEHFPHGYQCYLGISQQFYNIVWELAFQYFLAVPSSSPRAFKSLS